MTSKAEDERNNGYFSLKNSENEKNLDNIFMNKSDLALKSYIINEDNKSTCFPSMNITNSRLNLIESLSI